MKENKETKINEETYHADRMENKTIKCKFSEKWSVGFMKIIPKSLRSFFLDLDNFYYNVYGKACKLFYWP